MATVLVQQQALHHSTPPPSPIPPALTVNRRSSPIPNRHIPVCPTGPIPAPQPTSTSRPSEQPPSLLSPPDEKMRIGRLSAPPVYAIDGAKLAAALAHQASQPLPDASQMFPWLHGLHHDNHLQLGFFSSRKRHARRTPRCWRGILVVKLGGDLTKSRIKGAISAHEVLAPSAHFLMADPPEGFSVRNFQIQTAKLAAMSDIVIYAEDDSSHCGLIELANQFAKAQQLWRKKMDPLEERPTYNTFILADKFANVAEKQPEIIAIDAEGQPTGQTMDFVQWERLEMTTMSRASEISSNVWLGPTPDYFHTTGALESQKEEGYDLLIEACDMANIPGPRFLAMLDKQIETGPQRLEFPSSGSLVLPSGNTREVEDIVNTIRWIYYLAHPDNSSEELEPDGDIAMTKSSGKPRKVLIHCADGYTESSLLAVAYFMFAEGVPAHEAWLRLHCDKKRNFFAYSTDVAFLCHIQGRLLQESPATQSTDLSEIWDPNWFHNMDGSFPSRVLPYLYLGNLTHANNPELLWELGIKRVLSIGEAINWSDADRASWGTDNLMYIDNVQDNGIDPLCQEYDRCLDFIEKGKRQGTATLVHCRVGVSRSASICIAEVMASKKLSFPHAYCFVRARRLNVIIQPHLRFVYELLQWEEYQMKKRGEPIKRELEWTTVAREIALLNKPYSRH
ncbi:Protein-tyrosine/Dual-specificity phosphatase [Penicillium fimorum]|uniref:Protein-tyrosine/Dual-specificity phosphatase n=1 Tax=Penicillium fimorum TaxID=1882269 RepID=A0A9W9XPM4_9EURO|nr:Protein-tyrosine/Dual-specificity phosphatase [Penicillium fimorum]